MSGDHLRAQLEALAARWEADAKRLGLDAAAGGLWLATHDAATMTALRACAHDLRQALEEE